MADQDKWMPTRVTAKFQPNNAPIPAPPKPERVRKRSRSDRYEPAQYSMLKLLAWLNLVIGAMMVFQSIVQFHKLAELDHKLVILIGFFYVWFIITPIAVLLKWRIGFYLGLVANIPLLMAFPIGTILGFFICRAFIESKRVFGIR